MKKKNYNNIINNETISKIIYHKINKAKLHKQKKKNNNKKINQT